MFTANNFHTAIIQLIHRAGRGEEVIPELDDLIEQLEQTKPSCSASEWRQSIADIRGSLMTHFGFFPASEHVMDATDHARSRKVFFVEEAISRLAHLMVIQHD